MKHLNDDFITGTPTDLLARESIHSREVLSFVLGFANDSKTFSTLASERAKLAMEIYQDRRARDRLFEVELFADPAWDILLILYCASHSQQRLSVTSVCVSAAVPPTTALRWIEQLCRLELVFKTKSLTDGRVTWLGLAEQARQRLDRYFDGVLDGRAKRSLARAA